MATINTNVLNYKNGQVQEVQVQPEFCDKKSMEEWKLFLDKNFEQVLRNYRNGNKNQAPNSKVDVKKFQEHLKKSLSSDAAKMLLNFLPEQLKSSQYFYYPNLKDELETAGELLHLIFPAQDDFALETHFLDLSRMIRDKNEENKKRNEQIQQQLTSAFDLTWRVEFQRLKGQAEKCAPEPIKWGLKTIQEVHEEYFGPLLQRIFTNRKSTTTTTELDLDLQFQKECHESSLKKTASVFQATRSACYLIRLYVRAVEEQLEKNYFFPSETDFIRFSDESFLDSYNKIHVLTPAKHFQTVWNRLDDDVKSFVLLYKNKFWIKNLQICQHQDESVEKVVDFAVEKYKAFVDQSKMQYFGSGSDSDSDYECKIFKVSQLSLFHTNAQSVIKDCFTQNPRFKFTLTRELAWEKLNEAMAQLLREDLEGNEKNLKRMKSQQKLVMTIAENAYEKHMNHFFSSSSFTEGSPATEELEDFHLEAMKWTWDFYKEKLEKLYQFYYHHGNGVEEEGKDKEKEKGNETLEVKCAEMKQQLLREHKERVADVKEMKEKQQKLSTLNVNEDGTGTTAGLKELELTANRLKIEVDQARQILPLFRNHNIVTLKVEELDRKVEELARAMKTYSLNKGKEQ